MTEINDFQDIRDGVRALCARFPGSYWRALDRERRYPEAFVQALPEAGYLACLVPEAYGGSGLPPADSRPCTKVHLNVGRVPTLGPYAPPSSTQLIHQIRPQRRPKLSYPT